MMDSRLGPVSLATQSVLLVSASTTFQAPFALGVATSVRCVELARRNLVDMQLFNALSLSLGLVISLGSERPNVLVSRRIPRF